MFEGSIRAVNLQFLSFIKDTIPNYDRPKQLAFKRLTGKFEEPQTDSAAQRREDAWARWIGFDEAPRIQRVLGPNWAKARLLIHKTLSHFHMGELQFTNGSNFVPVGNRTSIAAKLMDEWTITSDCFDVFARYSYWHRALKAAVKKRFKSYCLQHGHDEKKLNRFLWKRYRRKADVAFEIYRFKLDLVVTYVSGNRWSTVPKNNSKDRSICLEPFCNMLVQRAVGLGIRACLKNELGIDLDTLADVHRYRISDPKVATIDLSDCSDAIMMDLCRYLLPRRVLLKVQACRSDMTLGPDDQYYPINKVSSMGNGFTFDLMSLILTALTRSSDENATVFGDDIICKTSSAPSILSDLQIAGFVINMDKTNVDTGYRESCGAHFVDNYGYVTSFDFKWVRTVEDLIVICNKLAILSLVHGEPFEALRARIWACIPRLLLGVATSKLVVDKRRPPSYDLDGWVRYGPPLQVDPKPTLLRTIRRIAKRLHKPGRISICLGVAVHTMRPRDELHSAAWSMFYQHIHNSRLSSFIPKVVRKSTFVARVDEEQLGFVNALLP